MVGNERSFEFKVIINDIVAWLTSFGAGRSYTRTILLLYYVVTLLHYNFDFFFYISVIVIKHIEILSKVREQKVYKCNFVFSLLWQPLKNVEDALLYTTLYTLLYTTLYYTIHCTMTLYYAIYYPVCSILHYTLYCAVYCTISYTILHTILYTILH